MDFSIYSQDPKTGEKSVSLTILWISVIYLISMGVLQALGKVGDTGMAMEFFGVSSGLYFGRRIDFNKTTKTSSVEQDVSNGGS